MNKKNYKLIFITLFLLISACSSDRESIESSAELNAPQKIDQEILIENAVTNEVVEHETQIQKKPSFEFANLMPKLIYGVPGTPLEIYFENLALGVDEENFFITTRCSCTFGRQERRRWYGMPTLEDIGEHALEITLKRRSDGEVFKFKTKLNISKESTDLKSLRLLIVGDSITRQQQYPNRLVRKLKKKLDLDVSTFGKISLNLSPYDCLLYTSDAADDMQ